MKQPFPLEAVPTAELPEGPAAALEPGHRQRGRGTALLCSQHLGQSLQEHFSQTHLGNIGFGVFSLGFFWLVVFSPHWLPALKCNFHAQDQWKGRIHLLVALQAEGLGPCLGNKIRRPSLVTHGVLCPLPPHDPSAPSCFLLGLDSHGKSREKSQLSPTSASKEGLKERGLIRVKLCSFWLATERKRSKDASNTEN